ncbi:Hypothetical_protein [Hexamita inflata]|uniref:Hypothetical_protein n=1 Tax=Hexamita inflata TaxID=28002 RepID=A0AA86UTG4_9EUKA|nr:Hypothetical protein HINF_LOCUS3993 [Hexamita inflata]CAI9970987.1 Hypothetical protein HINF_LOCUS58632 [Hexamita inflata]CAI9970990.1 Hypothetical protein HINF_LOCUS58635 [Hexamita inflata]
MTKWLRYNSTSQTCKKSGPKTLWPLYQQLEQLLKQEQEFKESHGRQRQKELALQTFKSHNTAKVDEIMSAFNYPTKEQLRGKLLQDVTSSIVSCKTKSQVQENPGTEGGAEAQPT